MSNTRSPGTRYVWFIALIVLPLLAWHGLLDTYSGTHLNASISSAGLIYGTARGINALVSLLQGTQLGFVVVTFSVGELLDPINDLIERFSQILLVALASLALQKILLSVVTHTLFNILLSVCAAITGVTFFLSKPELLRVFMKTFLVIAFLRFALGLVVLANTWVDNTFLNEADQLRHQAMEEFRGELREIDTHSQTQQAAALHIETIEQAVVSNARSYATTDTLLQELDAQIQQETQHLSELISAAGVLCLSLDLLGQCPAQVKEAKAKLAIKAERRSELLTSQKRLQSEMEAAREEISCIEKRSKGEPCKFWDRIPDAPDTDELRQKLEDINTNISGFAENSIDLLVSLLLKTVAIPLIFLYLLMRVLRSNLHRI